MKHGKTILLALCTAISSPALAAGTWTPLTHQPSFNAGTALLLTDGSVLVQANAYANGGSAVWWRLIPDNTGNYLNGTWKQAASISLPSSYTSNYNCAPYTQPAPPVACTSYAPWAFASAVLPDGRVIIEGGEYNAGVENLTAMGAIYDPKANNFGAAPGAGAWTAVNAPSAWTTIGDSPSVVLPNGTFMLGSAYSARSSNHLPLAAIYDPKANTWTSTGSNKGDSYEEEGFTLLPSGEVLTVDRCFGFPGCTTTNQSELYTNGTWSIIPGGTVSGLVGPLPLWYELGPSILIPGGIVFAAGGSGNTALYNPATDAWTAGPAFPNTSDGAVDAADAPAALLPNGNALIAASPGANSPGIHFFEFNGSTFQPEVGRTANASSTSSMNTQFLVLPTGQVLETSNTSDVEIYTPQNTTPYPGSAPTITSSVPATLLPGSSYSISGTQLNGISQGAAFGDEAQSSTNYPLVRITMAATNHVYYFRTHDHSTMGVATGSTTASTNFDVPANAELGHATLQVVANGIPSAGVSTWVGTRTITCPALRVGFVGYSDLRGSASLNPTGTGLVASNEEMECAYTVSPLNIYGVISPPYPRSPVTATVEPARPWMAGAAGTPTSVPVYEWACHVFGWPREFCTFRSFGSETFVIWSYAPAGTTCEYGSGYSFICQ